MYICVYVFVYMHKSQSSSVNQNANIVSIITVHQNYYVPVCPQICFMSIKSVLDITEATYFGNVDV